MDNEPKQCVARPGSIFDDPHSPPIFTPPLEMTLQDRGQEYGDYLVMAQVAQDLKAVMRKAASWGPGSALTATKRESLDLIATKIARILCGNPNNADSWLDIEGYARKARESIPVQAAATP